MRPVVRYFGGKWKLAPWIIGHFPEHRIQQLRKAHGDPLDRPVEQMPIMEVAA